MIILYIVLAVLVVLFVVIPLFLPSKVHVERSIEINADAEKIFPMVNAFRNWEKWSPWQQKDPDMQHTYFGESGLGHKHSWKGNKKVGQGSMTMTQSIPNRELGFDLQFGPNPKPNPVGFTFVETGSVTRVTWFMDVDFGMFLPGRYFGLMFDKWMAPDLEGGLSNLKTHCETVL